MRRSLAARCRPSIDARLTTLNSQFRTFLGAPPTGEWIDRAGRVAARRWRRPTSTRVDRRRRVGRFGPTVRRLRAQPRRRHRARAEAHPAGHVRPHRSRRPPPRCGALRLAAAGIYRLGTGQLDLPHDFTDVGTGDRQADIEVRGLRRPGPGLESSGCPRIARFAHPATRPARPAHHRQSRRPVPRAGA